jgi:hypothetical protein
MADPISALGALAAASQLVEQCLKLTLFLYEAHSRFHGSREFIDTLGRQVEQLTHILRQIISNPSLQTTAMAGVLQGCLNEAQSLYKFLQDIMILSKDNRVTRFKKTFTSLRKRGLIEARSESIERWKGLLVLCILEINSLVSQKTSLKQLADLMKREHVFNIQRHAGLCGEILSSHIQYLL